MTSIDDRRRRALWRATHRGTKEMDWLLGRYAEALLPAMSEAEIEELERLILVPDPDLQSWIMEGMKADDEHAALIDRIRAHHDVAPATQKANS